MRLTVKEALYGGAAGGGKSDALLMGALRYVDSPGYAALILRRTQTDLMLPEALLARSHEWFSGTDARWDGKNKSWWFPSKSRIQFGFLEHEEDKKRYQGSAYQYIAFDELTQFEESQYRYLFSRLRRLVTAQHIPTQMRGGSNPGGVGHEWVRQRFIVEGPGTDRVFIPAKAVDNPHLDIDDYIQSLNELDPITRAQLLDGDWEARNTGSIFNRDWFEKIDFADVPAGLHLVRRWDFASTEVKKGKDPDWTVGTLMGLDQATGFNYVLDVQRLRDTPERVEEIVKSTAREDGRAVPISIEQEPGSSGVMVIDHYVRKVLAGYTVSGERSTGSKADRAKPASSAAQRRLVRVLRAPWNTIWFDELEAFPVGPHDDQVDTFSGAFSYLHAGGWFNDPACMDWLTKRRASENPTGGQTTAENILNQMRARADGDSVGQITRTGKAPSSIFYSIPGG